MPTLIVDNESYHFKTDESVFGGLHWVLKNNKIAILHNRDLGMNVTIDPSRPKELKRIFNAHGIKSFYNIHNNKTINDFFSDAMISYSMLNNINKVESGIWVVPIYSFKFFPIFVIKNVKEFKEGYEIIAKTKFDINNECIRNVEKREDGLYLGTLD